ncbi:Beta-glucosidase 30 [Phytophthora cinnamomi]|uniref:Beta-glucosidase 30 n=1 Tax=Phytophthora cinnamomi TaxID=4785 RepID=UPI003559F7F8|nr:Beta-glucosidase 30 [Phytophthora cinnamomi]
MPPRASVLLAVCLGVFARVASFVAAAEARCFPADFLFGTATAAFQVEGAWNASGREPSIWDNYCRSQPGLQCADVADDFFHRYHDDVGRMAAMGLSSFRFSISWSRVMHWDARERRMRPNPQGLAFYHALLDDLQTHGLQPIATLYHFDLPLTLQTQLEPKGWLNQDIVTHFEDFAALAFREFGTKVKYWATFNEPLTFISGGYGSCDAAPGGMEPSTTNTYIVAHNVLVSHAKAVKLFREMKQGERSVVAVDARIGIVLNAEFGYPVEASNALDVAAAERKMQFDLGWFLMPLVTGEYPTIMRERIGERLPRFSAEEAALVQGSYDVLMLNHYYSRVVTDCDSERSKITCDELPLGHARDRGIDDTRAPNGARAPPASSPECSWLAGYPDGYLDTIKWMHAKDPSAQILLTENGWCGNEQVVNLDQLWYFQAYVEQVYKAVVEEKIPILGYTAWSFLENNEWGSYKPRFGLHYVNFTKQDVSTELARVPRPTAKWFAHLATTKCLDGWDRDTVQMDAEEKQEAAAPREKLHNPEAGGNDVGVPWSLTEVIVLIVVGVIVLGAITCEAMRELRLSSQGSPEELQVLITIED